MFSFKMQTKLYSWQSEITRELPSHSNVLDTSQQSLNIKSFF